MKPIIVDMWDMTDSTEVYESRPNPFLVYFIYVLAALIIAALGWMAFFEIDIVVKSNGYFRSAQTALDVSSSVSGAVTECNITEGQYVKEGDVLFAIDAEALEVTIADKKELLADVKQRIEMLRAYDGYLNGEENALEVCNENKYYNEFAGRKQLLDLSSQSEDTDIDTQKSQYQRELENAAQLISQYEGQIGKLRQAEECVKNRINTFDSSESYYESIVSSYISNYNVTVSEYDTKITEVQKQIEECEKQIEECEKQAESSKQQEQDMSVKTEETQGETTEKIPAETAEMNVDSLNQQITELQDSITKLSGEKAAALENLELQQLTALEQQIETVNSTMGATKSNQTLQQAQLEVLNRMDTDKAGEINTLTEKQRIAAELADCETKKAEYESALKQCDLESGNTKVMAALTGYICMNQELKEGSYVAQGSNVCRILPENARGYYAELCVENEDIAKLKEGQEVKFEIAAYPSSEYGYFTGTVESISKDIKVEPSAGSAYYLVKVKCEETTVTNKEGKTGTIMNGMACQAKIVVDEENILRCLLEKLDLVD